MKNNYEHIVEEKEISDVSLVYNPPPKKKKTNITNWLTFKESIFQVAFSFYSGTLLLSADHIRNYIF